MKRLNLIRSMLAFRSVVPRQDNAQQEPRAGDFISKRPAGSKRAEARPDFPFATRVNRDQRFQYGVLQ
jgi:hypothetical protein